MGQRMGWKDLSGTMRQAAKELRDEAEAVRDDYRYRDEMFLRAEELLDVAHTLEDLADNVSREPPRPRFGTPER